ncbi:hypothetical protein Tco_0209636 [Tanacetum coccineum]
MLINCINHGDHLQLSSTNVSVIENKNTKKGNAMYYPRFTNLIVNFVMAKDPSIPRRNKIQAWGNPVWIGVFDVLLPVIMLKNAVPYKDTRDEDKDTRGNTRDGKASQEGENHTRKSASILHEFYNDIVKLGLE